MRWQSSPISVDSGFMSQPCLLRRLLACHEEFCRDSSVQVTVGSDVDTQAAAVKNCFPKMCAKLNPKLFNRKSRAGRNFFV